MRIAVAKGRIFKEAVRLFERAGFAVDDLVAEDRRLVRRLDASWEVTIVRASDVPLFVARGACELGIVGLDTLRERGSRLFELLDLGIGRCRLALAGPTGVAPAEEPTRRWRVASKYPRLTTEALRAHGVAFDLVPLGGTLETAPEAGIADLIVDLVETGRTLAAHRLEVIWELLAVSSRLVAHPRAYYQHHRAIRALVERLLPHLPEGERAA